jgi:hypothetical protein
MKISRITETTLDDVLELPIQLAVCASGYEERARYVGNILGKRPKMKHVLGFTAHRDDLERPRNDETFVDLGYEMTICNGNSADGISSLVKDTLVRLPNKSNLVFDITSMTRYWYATFLDQLRATEFATIREMSIYFTYVPSRYEPPPKEQPPNLYVGPIPGFSSTELPDLPTALVLGLGHEPDKALGITEFIDAKELFVFMANPAFDRRFVRDVQRMNKELLARLPAGHAIGYPLPSITGTTILLKSLSEGLMRSHRLILVPLGPKIFSLICFLLAVLYPQISVWRVSSEEEEFKANRPPLNNPLVCRVDFVSTGNKKVI